MGLQQGRREVPWASEAASALEAMRAQPLSQLVSSGRACVAHRVSPGMKPGELHCERDVTSAAGWEALQDDEGDTYYYNAQTQATTWERPTA